MAVAAIPHGKSSRAAPGQRPRLRNISRMELVEHYHGDALLILNGVLRACASTRPCGSKNAQPPRIYNKSVLVAQLYLDRARNGVARRGHGARFIPRLVRLNGW